MKTWTVAGEAVGLRLDKFLAAADRLGSRARAASALGRGKVFLNDAEADTSFAATRLAGGDVVRVWMDRPGSAKRRATTIDSNADVQIVYEDEVLLVLNKPAGLLAVPLERRGAAPSVYEQIGDHLRSRKRRPFVVHRIDRDTSGLVMFAKDPRTQRQLKEQFKRREPERVYWAIVYGQPNPPAGTWRDHLVWDTSALIQKETGPRDPRGKEAISEYCVLEKFPLASLVEVRLRTGKRNQIRAQARLRGHALVGERRYIVGQGPLRPIVFARQALHAHLLAFRHPTDGRELRFEASLPNDLTDLLSRLRRANLQ